MNLLQAFTPRPTYYKIINENKQNYQYHNGLNIFKGTYNNILKHSCRPKPSGFHFTDIKNIHRFYDCGNNLYKVTLPTFDPNFKMMQFDGMFRSNMIILHNKYSLVVDDTYKKFNLDSKLNTSIINNISIDGDLNSLKLWRESRTDLSYTEMAMDLTESVEILDWWIKSGLPLKYSEMAMDYARNIKILNWWLKSGLPLKYSRIAMDCCNNTEVLNWWFKSGLKLKYSELPMNFFSHTGNITILNCWLESGLPLKFSKNIIDSHMNHNEIIEWWIKHRSKIEFNLVRGTTNSTIVASKDTTDSVAVALRDTN